MATCRGMRMGYAPLLDLLEPALAAGHKRLAVIGNRTFLGSTARYEARNRSAAVGVEPTSTQQRHRRAPPPPLLSPLLRGRRSSAARRR